MTQLYLLAQEYRSLAERLADLDMDVRLQTLIDSADELADKLLFAGGE